MGPVAAGPTSLFWMANALPSLSVQPLPRLVLFGRSKASKNPTPGDRTTKLCAPEIPPPGAALNTVTGASPCWAMSSAAIAAVNCPGDTNVVGRLTAFNLTTDDETNPAPLTVRVNPGAPAVADAGLSPVTVGAGLFTVNVCAFDVPPPGAGLKTVTAAVPAPAMSPGSIAAVSREADRKVVGRSPPFQRTVDVGTKPVPVTVSVNPGPPADAADGLKPVTVGAGLFTLNVCAFEVPPPG